MTDKFMFYVDKRLKEWVEWYSSDHSGLGYPSRSIEYVLMTEGIVHRSPGTRVLLSNEEAEEIESLVVEMESYNKRMAIALRTQYFGKRKTRDRSDELKLSASRFRAYVEMAHQWLAGRLSAKL
jgi:hypothetical protein